MGTFFNSICIPGQHREDVRAALERWLAVRGFVRDDGPVLFDLDGDVERGAYLVTSDRWTVLFYSHYEEERRLIRELQSELERILYVWVHDSDVWGYDLFDPRGFAGSFNSDPRSYQSFPDDLLGESVRPRTQANVLAAFLEMPEQAPALRRAERSSAMFKDDACRELCAVLGVEAAASSYEDLENGIVEDLGGWSCEQLVYVLKEHVRQDGDPAASEEVDVHDYPVGRRRAPDGRLYEQTLELPLKLREELRLMRSRSRRKLFFLRPASRIARLWRHLQLSLSRYLDAVSPRPEMPPPPARAPRQRINFRMESAVLVNERHDSRITLAAGAFPSMTAARAASVFAFKVGEVLVTCTARRLRTLAEVLKKPGRSQVLRDEKYTIADHKARHLVFELPPVFASASRDPSYLALYVVQTEAALYVFLYRYRQELGEAAETTIRQTVDSFRKLGD